MHEAFLLLAMLFALFLLTRKGEKPEGSNSAPMANKSNEPPNDTVGYYNTFVRSRIPELKVDPLGVSPAASQNYHPRPSEFFSRQLIVDFTNHMNQATGLGLETWMGFFSTTITHVTA